METVDFKVPALPGWSLLDLLLVVPAALFLIRYQPGRRRRTAAHTVRRELRTVIRSHGYGSRAHGDWVEIRPAGWAVPA